MKKRIPFGVWEPDSNAVGGMGRLTSAVNVIPVKGGYKVIDGIGTANGPGGNSAATGITPTNLIAAFSGISSDNTYTAVVYNRATDYLATTTAVYMVLGNNVPTTYTRTGAAPTSTRRDFAQYGEYLFLASGMSASGTSPIVYVNVGSASNFADSGIGYQANCVGTLRDFLVAGATYESTDGTRVNRVRWSAFGDPFNHTPSAVTQSDFQDLNTEAGAVQKILGGNEAFIVCDNMTVLMSYVGGQTIMRFDYIHNIGSPFPSSCVRVGDYVYMYTRRGFARVGKNPGDVTFFGDGKVDREFRRQIEASIAAKPLFQPSAYHDEMHKGIGWNYTTSSGKAFFYSYAYDQWVTHGLTDRDGGSIVYSSRLSWPANGYTTFGLSAVDSPRLSTAMWVGSDQKLYTHNDNSQKSKFQLATGFEELSPGRRSVVDKVWPVYDFFGSSPTNPECVVTSVPQLNGVDIYNEPTSTYSSTAALQSGGFFTVTGPGSYQGKFHRFQLENSDTASERTGEQAILGIDVEYFEKGVY